MSMSIENANFVPLRAEQEVNIPDMKNVLLNKKSKRIIQKSTGIHFNEIDGLSCADIKERVRQYKEIAYR